MCASPAHAPSRNTLPGVGRPPYRHNSAVKHSCQALYRVGSEMKHAWLKTAHTGMPRSRLRLTTDDITGPLERLDRQGVRPSPVDGDHSRTKVNRLHGHVYGVPLVES